MNGQHQPNMVESVRAIHAVITQGIKVVLDKAAFDGPGGPDYAASGDGFSKYVLGLGQVLNGHHLTEDELAFPYFRDKLPDMPFDKLSADHRRMVPIIQRLEGGKTAQAIEQAAEELDAIWGPHRETEEGYWTRDRLDRVLEPAEETKLDRMFAEHSQRNSTPDYLVVPFLLFNLPEDQRWVFADEFPAVVMQELLPKAWKPQWGAMAPFLLDQ